MGQDIVDQCDSIANRIQGLPPLARVAVAVGAAERLMSQHLELPPSRQTAFTVAWADVVSMLWKVLTSPSDELNQEIQKRLREYYSGPHCHELGEDALPGADEDAASAAIYATEAYCRGSGTAAARAAMQLLTDADARASAVSEAIGENLMSTSAKARRSHFQQIELDRLCSAVSVLEQKGVSETILSQLQDLFAK